MATINNVIIPNLALGASSQSVFGQIYSLTRAMKKAGWKHLASGDGITKSTDPTDDNWGNGLTTGLSGAAASITAVSRGRATVTGLSGITSEDKGRFLNIAGSGSGNDGRHQIEEIIDANSVRIDARTVSITAPDTNNGSLNWEIYDSVAESPASTLLSNLGWWLGRGPSVLKIPITSYPTDGYSGTPFINGENVVQSSTGAEGEITGFTFNAEEQIGFLVVHPRVRGTGSGPYGWDTGFLVSGSASGSTVIQNGLAIEYRNQIVIAKTSNQEDGRIFVQCIDPVGETADDFATLAASAGATQSTPPGGGGTGNGVPKYSYSALGLLGSGAGDVDEWGGNGGLSYGVGQAIATDCIEEQNYSADGTWHWIVNSVSQGTGEYLGRSFMKLDNTEPADLNPFVMIGMNSAGASGFGDTYDDLRTSTDAETNGSDRYFYSTNKIKTYRIAYQFSTGNGKGFVRGWRNRGIGFSSDNDSSVSDYYQGFEIGCERTAQSSSDPIVEQNASDPETIATEYGLVKYREPVKIISVDSNGRKTRKGTCKWMFWVQQGPSGQTYDNGQYIRISSDSGGMAIGPWNGVSVPYNI